MNFLNEMKPKYEHLNSIISDTVSHITFNNEIIVFVDVHQCIKKIFRRNSFVMPENLPLFIEESVSGILGIISHYRNYFYKNFGKTSTYYFIYSKSECEYYKDIFPEYRKTQYDYYYRDHEIFSLKSRILKAAEVVIKATPNAAFIDSSNFEDFNYVEFIINKLPSNQMALMLSDNFIWMKNLDKNVFAINGKGIESKLITQENVFEEYISSSTLSNKIIPLILAVAGEKHLSIEGVKSVSLIKAKNIIEKLIKDGKLLNSKYITFPKEVFMELGNGKLKTEENIRNSIEIIERNFSIFENPKLHAKDPSEYLARIDLSVPILPANFFINLESKLFSNYPINLEMYLKGEQ